MRFLHLANFNSTNIGNGALISGTERILKEDLGDVDFTPAVWDDYTFELKKFIGEKGYDAKYGARPLKRAIQSSILDPLAQELIGGKIRGGDSILVDVKGGVVEFVRGAKKIVGKVKRVAVGLKR